MFSLRPAPPLQASPGEYAVSTPDFTIESVAGLRFGVHSLRLHNAKAWSFAIAAAHLAATKKSDGRCQLDGMADITGFYLKYKVYIHMELDADCEIAKQQVQPFPAKAPTYVVSMRSGAARSVPAAGGGGGGGTPCPPGDACVEVRMALSYVDPAGARRNFAEESSSVPETRARARAAWAAAFAPFPLPKLGDRTVFDTAVYHSLVSPYLHSDVDGRFVGPDGAVATADGFNYYSFLSTWDTYRAWAPLMAKFAPAVLTDIVRTCLKHHSISGVLPRWTFAGREVNMMPAMHSITIMYTAVAHGLLSTAEEKAVYAAYLDVATARSTFDGVSPRRRVNFELRSIVTHNGVLLADGPDSQTVSQTLEYAICHHAFAMMAKRMNDMDKFAQFSKTAQVYRRLYDPATGYMTGLTASGGRKHDRKPFHSSNSGLWTEGNAIQWLFHVMHDIPGLLDLMGREKMLSQLQVLFTGHGTSELPDTTGMIGLYAHGNEPCHHIAFLYFMLGKPDLGLKYVQQAMTMYADTNDGIPGNDDAGQMSAWYVCAALRFYPVDPTNATFVEF